MAHEVTLITGDGTGPDLAEAARRCVDATGVEIIAEGKHVTYDLKPNRDDPTAVGTREMATAICEKL